MKKILITAMLIAGSVYMGTAQVNVSINIGSQPAWGPTGYDYVEYYYLPDLDIYYDVGRAEYVYLDGPTWVYRRSLPPRFAHYDIYHTYKVVVNEPTPWRRHDYYRTQYIKYRGRHDQPFIKESREERYFANPHHPQHNVWVQQHPAPPRQVGHPDRGPRPGQGPRPMPGPPHDGPGRGHDDHPGHGQGHGHGR